MTDGFDREETNFLKKLNTPEKIQDYLDTLDYNWCAERYRCKSPRYVMIEEKAHCFEGSLFAAAARRVNGYKPAVLELHDGGADHMIVPFKKYGFWGAIAQSRSHVLRWRDPVHKTIRELALSYFPFFVVNRKPVIKSYTDLVDLSEFDYMGWMTTKRSLGELGDRIEEKHHYPLFSRKVKLRETAEELEKIVLKHKPPREGL